MDNTTSQETVSWRSLPLGTGLARAGYRLGSIFAPALTGRIAADAFGRSRPQGSRSSFNMPLGAKTFAIPGNEDVRRGYVWENGGPTVLLIHGWGADSSSMTGFVNPLLALGFQVAAFDAPAHGDSVGHKTTMTRFAKAAEAAIAALGNVQIVIGHSLGSIAAVAAVAQADPKLADAIKCMVLLAAPTSLATVLRRWSSNHHQQLPERVIQKVGERLHVENGVPVSHWDIGVLGAELSIPILLLHDENDPVVPFSEAQRLLGSLKNCRLERTSQLGHGRILSSPLVKESISRFILNLDLNPVGREIK